MAQGFTALHRSAVMRRLVPALFVLATALPCSARPQSAGPVTGVVTDSSGAPIAGAEVVALGSASSARTGEAGAFDLGAVATGPAVLLARRLGFRPDTVHMVVTEAG